MGCSGYQPISRTPWGRTFAPSAAASCYSGRIDNAFTIAERHLANREYIAGAQPTIADMSMLGYMYYPPQESGYDIQKQYPAMAKWLERLKALPGWKPPYDLLRGERIAPRW